MAYISRLRLCGTLIILLTLTLSFGGQTIAQTSSSIVIDSVDDSAFPQVDLRVTVQGRAATPDALSVADFQLFEDGRRVPASAILVEAGDTQPVSLVLAVDVSTEPSDLAQIQSGLLALVDQLNPGDQAMLLSFFDEVRLVQPLTADLEQVRSAIRQLSAGGNFTALNRATVEAFTQAQTLPQGRRAVLIVTDSVENISDAAVNISGAGAIPSYIVAYSPKVQAPGQMAAFAQQIGADLTLVDTATAAQVRLQTLSVGSASRSYQLRFISQLPADDADHTVSINLSNGDPADRDNGTFRARPGAVTVDTPTLINGAQVGGLLSVTPQITAPAPVQTVEYLLNGQSLAVLNTAPFAYTVDTTGVTFGNNVIGLRVTDSAGNQAEHLVTVTVVDPLQVTVRTQPETYHLGDSVQFIADVTAANGISSVDFLLNDIVVAEVTNPPYAFTLDTAGYSPGALPLTVRVRDATGYAENSDVPVTLTSPPPRFFFTEAVWLRILAALSIVLTLVLAWLLLAFLASVARKQRRTRFLLELRNEGNGADAYLLRADDPNGRLSFSFLLKGLRLRGRNLVEWEPVRQSPSTSAVRTRQAAPAVVVPSSATQPSGAQVAVTATTSTPAPAGRAIANTQQSATARFGQGASWFASAAHSFGGLFEAMGRLLPASMGGAALQRAAAGAKGAYSQSLSVYRLNQEVEGAAGAVQDSRHILPTGQAAAQPQPRGQTQPQPLVTTQVDVPPGGNLPTTSAPVNLPVQVALPAPANHRLPAPENGAHHTNGHHIGSIDADLRTDANGVTYRRVVRHDPDAAWTETPAIAPGDTLQLELVIEPTRVGRSRTHPFQVRSLPLAESAATPLVTEGSAQIRGVSWLFWFLLPTLVVLIAGAIVLFMLAFLLTEFGLLPNLSGLAIPWLPFDQF